VKTSTPLWEYACALYEKQGVQQACLQLQDDHRVNVPLILFFCWAMTVKGGIDGQVLKQAAHRADIVDTGQYSLASSCSEYDLPNIRSK